jgi:hypothetical protein
MEAFIPRFILRYVTGLMNTSQVSKENFYFINIIVVSKGWVAAFMT